MLNGVIRHSDSSSLGVGELGHGYILSLVFIPQAIFRDRVPTSPSLDDGNAIIHSHFTVRQIISGFGDQINPYVRRA
jgi:hypothetical protein